MADQVEFKEPQMPNLSGGSRGAFESKITGAIISLSGGIVKDEKQAKLLLAVIISIIILVAVFIFVKSFQSVGSDEMLTGIPA